MPIECTIGPKHEMSAVTPTQPYTLLLRGAPAVGKTTAARHLMELGLVDVVCEVDAFRGMIADIDWGDRRQHSLALQAAVEAAVAFANGGPCTVVLVDCFGREAGVMAAEQLEGAGVSVSVVSLWAEPSVLRSRMAQRADDYDNLEMALLLNEEVRTRRVDDILIDTTLLPPLEVSARIEEAVRGGPCR